jgi:hypothetical protein
MSKDCPECKGKIQIKESYPTVEGDNSPNTPTKLYTNLDMACMNKSCSKYCVVVETIKHEQKLR